MLDMEHFNQWVEIKQRKIPVKNKILNKLIKPSTRSFYREGKNFRITRSGIGCMDMSMLAIPIFTSALEPGNIV